MEQKVDEAMVAVGDEVGLKRMIGDDLSDSENSDVDDISTCAAISVILSPFKRTFCFII